MYATGETTGAQLVGKMQSGGDARLSKLILCTPSADLAVPLNTSILDWRDDMRLNHHTSRRKACAPLQAHRILSAWRLENLSDVNSPQSLAHSADVWGDTGPTGVQHAVLGCRSVEPFLCAARARHHQDQRIGGRPGLQEVRTRDCMTWLGGPFETTNPLTNTNTGIFFFCSVAVTYKTTALETVEDMLEKLDLTDADPLFFQLWHRSSAGKGIAVFLQCVWRRPAPWQRTPGHQVISRACAALNTRSTPPPPLLPPPPARAPIALVHLSRLYRPPLHADTRLRPIEFVLKHTAAGSLYFFLRDLRGSRSNVTSLESLRTGR